MNIANVGPTIVLYVLLPFLVLLGFFLGVYKIKKLVPKPPFRFLRGAEIVSPHALAKLTRAAKSFDRRSQLLLGQVPIPAELEDRHYLLVGTSGAGKSVAIKQLLPGIRAREARAIVMDLGSEFVSQFRQPGDLIFCPGEPESVLWNPLSEVKTEQDIDLILQAMIPTGPTPSDESWLAISRSFLKALMLRLWEERILNIEKLRYYTSCSDKVQATFLAEGRHPYKLNGTSMTSTAKDMISNVMVQLRPVAEVTNFSIREWVKSGQGFLFITLNNSQRANLSGLVNCFMNLAIAEGLTAPPTQRYEPLFIVVDELAAFDFDDLPGILERGRKYGVTAVAGIQNAAQLRKKYGPEGALTLMSCFRTKLIFNPGDSDTAYLMASEIGKQDIERLVYATTESGNSRSHSVTYKTEQQFAVLPEQLIRLRDRDAYLKLVGDYPVAKVRIPLP
jgi:type IV secretory pathway TraG/TraD family ATPase VirD4